MTFQQRINIMAAGLACLGLLAGLRLVYLQIIRHGYYQVLASDEQSRKFQVLPTRGEIFAFSRGEAKPLVLNRSFKTLYADANYVVDPDTTAAKLAGITGEDASQYRQKLQTDSAYVVLKKQVEPNVAETIKKLQLPGIGLNEAPTRVYPEGSLAAHLLGFVNQDGGGQYGIEEQMNQQLSGRAGLLDARTDTLGIPIASGNNIQVAPQDGSNVYLTIDSNLQAKMEQVLKEGVAKYKAKSASAVVMDPNNGAILAMANYPTYNPGNFADVSDYNVFSNRAATGLYEPGSVFKIFSMAAGLDSGAVTPDSRYTNTGSTKVRDRVIENVDDGAYRGSVRMTDVITRSLNTGVVEVLRRLGGGEINSTAKEKLYDYYVKRFQFGRPTGVDLPGEPAGSVNAPDSDDVNYANMTFGQGLGATMLQVATAAAAAVNGGNLWRPYVVHHSVGPEGQITRTEPTLRANGVISAQSSQQIKAMMETVVQSGGGFGTKIAGYRIGGKTGTAQIPNPEGGYFDNRDIGSFVGVAPIDSPRYVMIVRADEPQIGRFAGSSAAGPMFGDIMRWLLRYEAVPPS